MAVLVLYLIWFLHQTTTHEYGNSQGEMLYLIWFLHQTTTSSTRLRIWRGCILSGSYIKPQPWGPRPRCRGVVSYLVPTSNHNSHQVTQCTRTVVSYLVPTSNHNRDNPLLVTITVVSYLVPTSNHNMLACEVCRLFVVSYLVPTSNHNWARAESVVFELYLIWFLHQTTTRQLHFR